MSRLTPSEVRDLTLSVGTHRSDRRLSPLEVAQLIKKMVRSGLNRKDCAQRLGISVTQVSSFLRILQLDIRIQHLADWRGTRNASIPFSTLAELSRLDADEQIQVAKAVLRHGLKWKEVVQIVQISDRSNEAASICIDKVLALRTQIETHHLFLGVVTSASQRAYLTTIPQVERDSLLRQILRQLVGAHYNARSRLNHDSFTILSSHDFPQLIKLSPDELEEAVNEALISSRQ